MGRHQLTVYAATKKANESVAHSYAHLWDLPTTMFRSSRSTGPGATGLAYYKFVDAILDGRPIDVYSHGDMYRDFTHVGDLVRDPDVGRRGPKDPSPRYPRLRQPVPGRAVPDSEHRDSDEVKLLDFIDAIEDALGLQAKPGTTCRCNRATCTRPG